MRDMLVNATLLKCPVLIGRLDGLRVVEKYNEKFSNFSSIMEIHKSEQCLNKQIQIQ